MPGICFRGATIAFKIVALGIALLWNISLLQSDETSQSEKRVLTAVEGTFGYWVVLEKDGMRFLVCDNVIQGAIPVGDVPISPAELIHSRDYIGLIPYYRPATRTSLLIGLGAGIHARAFEAKGIKVHSVDIEPAVVPLAKRYFHFKGEATIEDGRAFLEKTARKFDCIILDTFQGGGVPKQLYSQQAFRLMADRLETGGVLGVHLIANPQHAATKAVGRTLSSVFPHMVTLRSGRDESIQHIYLLASDRPLNLGSRERIELDQQGFTGDELYEIEISRVAILTDTKNNLDKLSQDLARVHRLRSQEMLGKTP